MTKANEMLERTLSEYDEMIDRAADDQALSDSGRQTIVNSCISAKAAVRAFVDRLAAQSAGEPSGDYEHGYADGVEWATVHAQPPTAQEPAAWQFRRFDGKWFNCDRAPTPEIVAAKPHLYRPLYAALSVPPGDQAREAMIEKVILIAQDVVWFDWSNNDSDAVHTMEQLRLALAALSPEVKKP